MLPQWKVTEYPWLKEADSQALQSAILNLDAAYRNFFERRAGFPRFLKKHDARQSIQYPQRVKIEGDRLYLPKVGWVKAEQRFKTAKTVRQGEGAPAVKLRDFFGSNVAKDRMRVARAHERVRSARNDWQHKLSRQLADENQAVAAETLNVKGMMKNRRLSRAIADVGWGSLLLKIDYKLKRRGGHLVKIDRWFPSTKTCSDCGAIHEGLTLSDRTWLCTACDTLHDRDENAAENIRRQGILKLKAEGLSVSAHGGGVIPGYSCQVAANEMGSLRLQA